MLKPTLLVGLVLLQYALSAPIPTDNNYQCLGVINSLRANYAHDYQIANMNELVYDQNYESYFYQFRDSICNSKPTFHDFGKIQVFTDVKNDPDAYDRIISGVDIQRIGCLKKGCEETGRDVWSIAVDRSSAPLIFGTPGTRCPEGKPSNNNGLCSTSVKTKYARKGFFDGIFDGLPELSKDQIEALKIIEEDIIPDCFGVRDGLEQWRRLEEEIRKQNGLGSIYSRKSMNPDKPKSLFSDSDIFENLRTTIEKLRNRTSTFPRFTKPPRIIHTAGGMRSDDDEKLGELAFG